jgi:hypothetical protein
MSTHFPVLLKLLDEGVLERVSRLYELQLTPRS